MVSKSESFLGGSISHQCQCKVDYPTTGPGGVIAGGALFKAGCAWSQLPPPCQVPHPTPNPVGLAGTSHRMAVSLPGSQSSLGSEVSCSCPFLSWCDQEGTVPRMARLQGTPRSCLESPELRVLLARGFVHPSCHCWCCQQRGDVRGHLESLVRSLFFSSRILCRVLGPLSCTMFVCCC